MTFDTDSRVAFSPDLPRNLQMAGWQRVDLLEKVDSTNAYALQSAQPWHLVCAHEQTAGRGRMARSWQVPAGASVSLSVTMPLPREASTWGWVPLFAGAAVLTALQNLCPSEEFALKWPNDVLVRESSGPRSGSWAKIAGILCQVTSGSAGPGSESIVVVGVGVNVLQNREELPVPNATSLSLLGSQVTRDDAVRALAGALHDVGSRWGSPQERDTMRARVRSVCSTIGSDVVVHTPAGEKIRTRAEGIDDEGRLVTRVPSDPSAAAPMVESAAVAYSAADIEHVRSVEGVS